MDPLYWTKDRPTKVGYYFYAKRVQDWDLYRVAKIQRIEDYRGIRYEVWTAEDPQWVNVASQEFNDYIWFGPLPKPTIPDFV